MFLFRAGIAGVVIAFGATCAAAQMGSDQPAMQGSMAGMMMNQPASAGGAPTLPGQDAFGAIQEIVAILEADPHTDWSKVNIAALREHLIDMNEVTLRADAVETKLANGVSIDVTGEGRTLEAIRRMVPAQTKQLNHMDGWSAIATELPDGVRLVVTSSDGREAVKLRALGFMGLMVEGHHHQTHHLMIAKGEMVE